MMCQSAPVWNWSHREPKFRGRYCGRCIEQRKREGLNRVELVCKVEGCGKKSYPYAKDAAAWGTMCRGCKFDDMVARGAKVSWETNANGRSYRVATFENEPATRFEREDVL